MVLSSKFIPGNERAITHIINEFSRRGARVMYEKVSDVHVSGHTSEENCVTSYVWFIRSVSYPFMESIDICCATHISQ